MSSHTYFQVDCPISGSAESSSLFVSGDFNFGEEESEYEQVKNKMAYNYTFHFSECTRVYHPKTFLQAVGAMSIDQKVLKTCFVIALRVIIPVFRM